MAVSGVSSSKSIYGNRNVITGLASGMDTESMLENAISAYKNKIATLNQKRTKTVWKQDTYRSIINKMASFTSKYTSYQSSNNLMSLSFFNQAVKTVSKGKNADMVSATGRSSSNVQIDRVLQLATAATYKRSGSVLDPTTSIFGSNTVSAAASSTMDLGGTMEVSGLNGSLTLAYGGQDARSYLSINFDDTTLYENQTDENGDPISAEQALVNEINRQLETQSVTIGTKTYTGKDLTENVVRAELKNGKITFVDPKKNGVYISGAKGTAEEFLDGQEISSVQGKQIKELTLNDSALNLLGTHEETTLDYLRGRNASLEVAVDGVTKTIRLPSVLDLRDSDGYELKGAERDKKYLEVLQKNIDSAFGKGKLKVSNANEDGDGIKLQFEVAKGSTFSVASSQGKVLGFGESKQVTSYLNTGKTLGELLSGTDFSQFAKAKGVDASGRQLYSFRVNGVEVGQFNENSTLLEVMNAMNNNSESGVGVSYSRLTNELTFTAKETGAASQISFSGLSAALFGAPNTYDDDGLGTYTEGQNALFEATVNGTSLGLLERSSNSVDMDGMTINLKGTFGYQTNDDGSIKYNISYETVTDNNGKERIAFTYGNGKTLYGELRTDGVTVDLFDIDGNALTDESGRTVTGTVNENGKLSFYTTGTDGQKESVYLTTDGSFTTTEGRSYDTKDGKIVFKYGDGKEIYGEQAGEIMFLRDAEGNALLYNNQEMYGKMDEDGNLNFYVYRDGKDTQVYLTSNGSGSATEGPFYDMKDGKIVFEYGNGKKLYGEYKEDGLHLYNENGSECKYWPSDENYKNKQVYGEMDDDGNLSLYVTGEDGKTRKLYLEENGNLTADSAKAVKSSPKTTVTQTYASAKATVTQTTSAKTTVTKTGEPVNTEAVTFETSSDADKIVDVIKQMVADYNEMVTEIRKAYATLPAQKSNGVYYEPLTEEDEEGATETFINNWNEKAKQGVLFGDSNLRDLYTRLTSAISLTGEFGETLRTAGITVSYVDGLSTLSFNEDKFRTALENNPDKVRDAFAASTDAGAKTNGLMQSLKLPLDIYGKTAGGKGILVELAGSPLAASTMYSNTIQTQLNDIDMQIEKWQDLMNNRVDYYTKQFSRLEQLVQQMNSQSSYFSQLMGGY